MEGNLIYIGNEKFLKNNVLINLRKQIRQKRKGFSAS